MPRKNKSFSEPYKDWIRFVDIGVEIFCTALNLLMVTDEMKKDEDSITKDLYKKLKDVCFKHKDKPQRPSWDAKTDTEKRPDFTCRLVNPFAESVDMSEIDLHIECKCIGNNRSPSWNLNKNYITDGIKRFDALSHEYGKCADDGIMIGYIISSTKEEIQRIMNEKLPENIEKLNFKTKSKVEKISTKFKRKNVEPLDFRLHHIWANYA